MVGALAINEGSDEVKSVTADDAAAALTAQGTSYRAGGWSAIRTLSSAD